MQADHCFYTMSKGHFCSMLAGDRFTYLTMIDHELKNMNFKTLINLQCQAHLGFKEPLHAFMTVTKLSSTFAATNGFSSIDNWDQQVEWFIIILICTSGDENEISCGISFLFDYLLDKSLSNTLNVECLCWSHGI